ncbi:HEPN domain-containing protein [bacterium]|nr:HEPN domain-containing protein [bacterium]
MGISEEIELKKILSQAEKDLLKAEKHFDASRYDLACHLSEKAVEEIIKGFLKSEGIAFFTNQPLPTLFQKASTADKRFSSMETFAFTFEQFRKKTSTEKPEKNDSERESSTKTEAMNVINFAHKIIGLVKQILKEY